MKDSFAKLKSIYNDVYYLISEFKKTKIGKRYIILRIVDTIIDSIFPIIYTIIPGMIINELSGSHNSKRLILYVTIISVSPLFMHIKGLTVGLYCNKLSQKLVRLFEVDLHSYIADMEYSSFECPEITIQKSRIINGAPEAPIDMLNMLLKFLLTFIELVSVITIVAYLNAPIIAILLIFVIINIIINKKISAIVYNHGLERSKQNNVFWNEFDNLSNPHNGKEIRLYGLKDFLINRYLVSGNELDKLSLEKDKRIKKIKTITVITTVAQTALLYVFPIVEVIYFNLAIGTMTIFMSAGNKFANSLNNLSKSFLEISNYCLHVKEIRDFRNMPLMQSTGGKTIPSWSENSIIEFKNVSFIYPGNETYVLKNFNIKIPCKQKLCIVGENGSGKTTFIKLLTGLYYPTEGEILLDGVNIKQFDRSMYMKLFAPVFQDYCKYSLPLSLNVALEEDYDLKKILSSIDKSELSSLLPKLSHGYDTYVGKKIDKSGFEPSGGEGQKIAIARAIYHDRPIYILDEPTAALDPATEWEIYSTFGNIITNRTTLLITHRMSAVQLADCIAVFKNGKVIEYGTHKELYAKGGIYTEMFDKQAQFYRDKKTSDN